MELLPAGFIVAMLQQVKLGTGKLPNNQQILIAFLICTAFTLLMFGQALGQKDRERERCETAKAGENGDVASTARGRKQEIHVSAKGGARCTSQETS